jgi:hypothetical protein
MPDIENHTLGPTGRFPQGKLRPEDEGELRIGIVVDVANRQVAINFGTPVEWLSMNPETAREVASALVLAANRALDGRERG